VNKIRQDELVLEELERQKEELEEQQFKLQKES